MTREEIEKKYLDMAQERGMKEFVIHSSFYTGRLVSYVSNEGCFFVVHWLEHAPTLRLVVTKEGEELYNNAEYE